ncbi:ATP-binding protein, partial [Asanoa sp. NPDC050611]|uniref:ATP-binding protein n=1 Tax=Asanoa sp. NPDC050611 TaxID=3157098 RepID=UPI0034091463
MIGRDAELAVLAGALAAAEAGSGTLLVLEGPAGIGKTTLLDAAATDARRRGLAVLRARGNPLERDFPFGIARQLFAPLQSATTWPGLCRGPAALADRVLGAATPAPANSADATAAAAHGLFCLTANQAAAERTVLCVDDLHWADLPSLRWLAGVARRVEDLGVAVVATVRSGDPSVSPGALDELLTGATVRLGPLPRHRAPARRSASRDRRPPASRAGR